MSMLTGASTAPVWDLPALQLQFGQTIEFYEADNRSSLAKIEWKDKNGIHFGGTSGQRGVPVAFGGQEKVPVMFNSYPEGGSELESPVPNMTRYIFPGDACSSCYRNPHNNFADCFETCVLHIHGIIMLHTHIHPQCVVTKM